jgi:hypothetical protein
MADDDDEFVNSVMQYNGINWWEMDEGEWLRLQRDAGAFRSFEDECIALVTFRHAVKLRERGAFEQPSRQASSPSGTKPRERKRSITSRVKAAQKAGAKDVDIKPDGTVTAAFGTEPIPNEWDADLLGIDKAKGH